MREKRIKVQNGQKIDTYFEESRVEKVARACRFVQRRSPLGRFIFLKGLIFGFIQYPRASLNQLCQTLRLGCEHQFSGTRTRTGCPTDPKLCMSANFVSNNQSASHFCNAWRLF